MSVISFDDLALPNQLCIYVFVYVAFTFCSQTQVHEQRRRVHQGVVIQAVRILQLIHQPAYQIILYHGSLLAPSTET